MFTNALIIILNKPSKEDVYIIRGTEICKAEKLGK